GSRWFPFPRHSTTRSAPPCARPAVFRKTDMIDAVKNPAGRMPALFGVAVLALLASGCETFGGPSLGKRIDYKSTGTAPPLEIPPDLDNPRFDDRFSTATTTASGLAAKQATSPQKRELLPQNPQARIVRAGTER